MIKKIKDYLTEIIQTVDEGLHTRSTTYHDRINNYNIYLNNMEEKYIKKLNLAREEVRGLEKKYKETFIKNISSGKFKEQELIKIKEKVEKHYEENNPAFLKTLWMMFDGTKEFMKYDFSLSEELSFDFEIFKERPPVNIEWGQTICTEETCLKRIKLILRDFTEPDTKVLFIGDDDLNSLVMSSLSNFNISVIDIDDRLLKFIKEKSPEINTLKVDLNKDIPENLLGFFDAVAINPYWNYQGIKMFLDAAKKCLNKNKKSRIYITLWPVTITEKEYVALQKKILDEGFIFREIIPFFDWYDISDKHLYPDIVTILDTISGVSRDMKEPLLEKITNFPASTAYMHILSPASCQDGKD